MSSSLCFDANFIEKPLADGTAADFKRLGYNTVRFHHTDVPMMKGGWTAWNAGQAGPIDPAQLDKLDYLFAAMKQAGLYVSIDPYAMGCYGKSIAGVDKNVYGEMKGLLPIHAPARKASVSGKDGVGRGDAEEQQPVTQGVCRGFERYAHRHRARCLHHWRVSFRGRRLADGPAGDMIMEPTTRVERTTRSSPC